jgi:hypothetical protein
VVEYQATTDTLCSKSAIHLSVAVGVDNYITQPCSKPPMQVLGRLNLLAILDLSAEVSNGPLSIVWEHLLPEELSKTKREYHRVADHLSQVPKLAKGILNKVFTMHPHWNAFDGMDFGTNTHSVLVATMDNHLHSCEAGVMLNLADVADSGLTNAEISDFEWIICCKIRSCKSSASSDYPCGMVKSGVGKLTLCSHKENVGSIFYLLLALHDPQGWVIFEKEHKRQKGKYQQFPTAREIKAMNDEEKKKQAMTSGMLA